MVTASPEVIAFEAAMRVRRRHQMQAGRHVPAFPGWLNQHFPTMVWDKPHHAVILDALQRLEDDEYDRLMIFIPPRHGKTQMVTVRATAWKLEREPETPVILAAYNQTLAEKFSRQVRRIVRERVALDPERTAVNDWQTAAGGGLRAAGVGGGITGMGGKWIVIDDPIRGREEADSVAFRERVWEWYTDDLYTRREPGAKMILILTRWHQDDLAGRILASEDGPSWHVVHIPAIAMDDDPLGRDPGAALWPERVSAEDIQKYRAFNERGYWALYQGMPQPEGGAIILRDWWADSSRRYSITEAAPRNLTVGRWQFWDTAEEAHESAAFTTCTTFDLLPDYSVNVREVYRARLMFPDLLEAIERQARRHNRDEKLADIVVEYASSGKGTYQTLKANAPEWLRDRIKRYRPRDSKVDRAKAASQYFKAGLVRLPLPDEACPWLHDLESELYSFPTGQFKDQVDSMTMGTLYLRNYLALALQARGMSTDVHTV